MKVKFSEGEVEFEDSREVKDHIHYRLIKFLLKYEVFDPCSIVQNDRCQIEAVSFLADLSDIVVNDTWYEEE